MSDQGVANPPSKLFSRAVVIFLLIMISPFLMGLLFFGAMTVYDAIDTARYKPTAEFDSARWKTNPKYRHAVLKHVTAKIVSIKQTKDEVVALLGHPNSIRDRNWQYDVQRPGYHLIDFSGGGLLIEFNESGIVSKVSNNFWVD